MDQQSVLRILENVGAVIVNSHLVYTSGRHGSAYVNKDALYPHTRKTSLLCRYMARLFAGDDVEVVVAPTVGGVILSQWTAYHLSELAGREVLSVYADKISLPGDVAAKAKPGVDTTWFAIGRGYDKLVAGRKVLVVEDLLTTGGSARKVVTATRKVDGYVVGVGVLCNRGGVTSDDLEGVPRLEALVNVKMDTWDEKDCPLCATGVPINIDVGHGREFLAQKKVA